MCTLFVVSHPRRNNFPRLCIRQHALAFVLALVSLLATYPQALLEDQQASPGGPQYMRQNPEQLQQLVAPIALYPDSLVAQILAGSTFPEQIVAADQWVHSHSDLSGETFAQAVDKLPWDPSVKALTAYPDVLGNMDKNLAWTSSLGDAYYNQEQDVMDSIQSMRHRAQQAGSLNSTPQQIVTSEDSNIEIEPVSPEIVYVPAYDPWAVYGSPIVAWPGWYQYPGIWYNGPSLFFGVGFGTALFGHYGWGWHHWNFDWHRRYAVFDHTRYYSSSRTFYNRDRFYRGGAGRTVSRRGSASLGGGGLHGGGGRR